jgi:hypothetical protein
MDRLSSPHQSYLVVAVAVKQQRVVVVLAVERFAFAGVKHAAGSCGCTTALLLYTGSVCAAAAAAASVKKAAASEIFTGGDTS